MLMLLFSNIYFLNKKHLQYNKVKVKKMVLDESGRARRREHRAENKEKQRRERREKQKEQIKARRKKRR